MIINHSREHQAPSLTMAPEAHSITDWKHILRCDSCALERKCQNYLAEHQAHHQALDHAADIGVTPTAYKSLHAGRLRQPKPFSVYSPYHPAPSIATRLRFKEPHMRPGRVVLPTATPSPVSLRASKPIILNRSRKGGRVSGLQATSTRVSKNQYPALSSFIKTAEKATTAAPTTGAPATTTPATETSKPIKLFSLLGKRPNSDGQKYRSLSDPTYNPSPFKPLYDIPSYKRLKVLHVNLIKKPPTIKIFEPITPPSSPVKSARVLKKSAG